MIIPFSPPTLHKILFGASLFLADAYVQGAPYCPANENQHKVAAFITIAVIEILDTLAHMDLGRDPEGLAAFFESKTICALDFLSALMIIHQPEVHTTLKYLFILLTVHCLYCEILRPFLSNDHYSRARSAGGITGTVLSIFGFFTVAAFLSEFPLSRNPRTMLWG